MQFCSTTIWLVTFKLQCNAPKPTSHQQTLVGYCTACSPHLGWLDLVCETNVWQYNATFELIVVYVQMQEISHIHLECTRSQQDRKFTGAGKLFYMPPWYRPYVVPHEMDSGQKSGYYAAIWALGPVETLYIVGVNVNQFLRWWERSSQTAVLYLRCVA